jgi:hypothetical protein
MYVVLCMVSVIEKVFKKKMAAGESIAAVGRRAAGRAAKKEEALSSSWPFPC